VTQDGPAPDPRSSLAPAIRAVASGADLDATLAEVLAAGVAGLGAAIGAIFLQDPDQPGLQMVAAHGLDEAGTGALTADAQDPASPFATAASTRLATFDREAPTEDGTSFIGAYLPLVTSSGGVEVALGSIGMGWPAPHDLSETDREVLETIAALAAVTIDRARLASTAAERSEWFERLAHTDGLTGLANERTVARILELELARAGRQGSEVSLALFDIDDFRATNADGGHVAGDDVLRRVAAVLAESVRLVDTVGRIGGDEFVLVAPGSAGAMVARRILEGIATLPAVAGRTISVSAGVVQFPADGADAESLIAAATATLDRARGEGHGHVAESGAVAEL